MHTLRDNLQLSPELALPAHGHPFTNVKERIHELLFHHEERLNLIKELVASRTTVYSICQGLFGENLNAHEMRFAVGETAAHLMYLVYRGEFKVEEREEILSFGSRD